MKRLKFFALALCAFSFSFHAAHAQTAAQNKANALKGMEYINTKNYDGLLSLLADNYTEYAQGPEPTVGKEAFKAGLVPFLTAFPDYKLEIEKVVAEGNTVMIVSSITGTFKADLGDMKATGKSFKYRDCDILEFDAQGKVVKHWAVADPSVIFMQVGK
jgi:predicted ester cyclase